MSGNIIRPGGAGGASWGELPGEGHNLVVAGRREGSLSPGRAVQFISVVETTGRSGRGFAQDLVVSVNSVILIPQALESH